MLKLSPFVSSPVHLSPIQSPTRGIGVRMWLILCNPSRLTADWDTFANFATSSDVIFFCTIDRIQLAIHQQYQSHHHPDGIRLADSFIFLLYTDFCSFQSRDSIELRIVCTRMHNNWGQKAITRKFINSQQKCPPAY